MVRWQRRCHSRTSQPPRSAARAAPATMAVRAGAARRPARVTGSRSPGRCRGPEQGRPSAGRGHQAAPPVAPTGCPHQSNATVEHARSSLALQAAERLPHWRLRHTPLLRDFLLAEVFTAAIRRWGSTMQRVVYGVRLRAPRGVFDRHATRIRHRRTKLRCPHQTSKALNDGLRPCVVSNTRARAGSGIRVTRNWRKGWEL